MRACRLTFLHARANARAHRHGPALLQRTRGDFVRRYERLGSGDMLGTVFEYIALMAHRRSGESAFGTLFKAVWPLRPMDSRVAQLSSGGVPVTLLYGDRTWMTRASALRLARETRGAAPIRVDYVKDAGHHVYADNPFVVLSHSGGLCDGQGLTATMFSSPREHFAERIVEAWRRRAQREVLSS